MTQKKGTLTLWEAYPPENGALGTTIRVKPADFKDFAYYEKEKYVLVNAKSGQPITYYLGAGWSKAPQFETKQDWLDYVSTEIANMKF